MHKGWGVQTQREDPPTLGLLCLQWPQETTHGAEVPKSGLGNISFAEVTCMLRPMKEPGGSHMGGFPVLTKCIRDVSWEDKDNKMDRDTKNRNENKKNKEQTKTKKILWVSGNETWLHVQGNMEMGNSFLLVSMIQTFRYHWDRLETKLRDICNYSHNDIIFIGEISED